MTQLDDSDDPVKRFPEDRIRTHSCAARIKRAAAEAIKRSKLSREDIAAAMSELLVGETITPAMLDQYTSTANERNNIPAYRLMALVVVTGDVRIINAALQDTPFVAVDHSVEALLRRERAQEDMARAQREFEQADAQWRASK